MAESHLDRFARRSTGPQTIYLYLLGCSVVPCPETLSYSTPRPNPHISCAGPERVLEHLLCRCLQFRSMLPLNASKHFVDSVVELPRPATVIALWEYVYRRHRPCSM